MVQVNSYPEQTVNLFSPEGESMGFVNELQFADVRCQICENNLSGYYIEFNNEKTIITPNGELENWPAGLFDSAMILFARLFRARGDKM